MYLEDLLLAMNRIAEYIEGMSFIDFKRDYKTVDAVIRNFEIIGEAANNIPEEIKAKHPKVEWKECVGFRNFLIHGYFMVSLETVWDTIQKNLPQLKEHVKDIREQIL